MSQFHLSKPAMSNRNALLS